MLGGRYERIQAVLDARARWTRKGCKEVGEDGEGTFSSKADTESRKGCVALCARAFGRWLSALAIVSLLLPSVALAQSGFSWCSVDGPFVTGGSTYDKGYVVLNCSNANLAALAVIGRSGDYLQLTSDQLAKLSNESTGGAFYTLTSRFRAVGASGSQSPYYPSWWGGGSIGGVVDNAYAAMMVDASGGYGTVWAVETSAAQIASALEDYEVIYNGGDLGGGSGGATGDFPTILDFPLSSFVGTDDYKHFGSGTSTPLLASFKVSLPSNVVNSLQSYKETYEYSNVYALCWRNNGISVGETMTCNILFTNGDYTIDGNYIRFSSGVVTNTFDLTPDVTGNALNEVSPKNWRASYTNLGTSFNRQRVLYMIDVFASTTPVLPPNNWPDPPSDPTPTPPTVPDPPTDTPITQPTPPTDPTPPTYPITTIYEGDTYVVADIAAILDAMDEHCQHLQQAIYNAASDLYESLSDYLLDEFQATRQSIHNDLGWLGGLMHDELQSLMDYLNDLFIWLANRLSFTYDGFGYNDSNVISWLRAIYLKLGNGGGNTRPIDPVSDPFGIGKWLNDLWTGFLGALLGIGANGLDDVVSELQRLTGKFPFSVPWDIAALLGILLAQPVAPVVDVPQFAVDAQYGLVRLQDMRIDMSVYDVYWGPVRMVEKIGFAVFLATQTKDMMELLGSALGKER